MKKKQQKRAKKSASGKEPAHRTWVEVDYRAIEKNARALKSLLAPEVALMAVVKSNGYGHGMIESAKAALKGGATWLAVDELAEALELRGKGIKSPVLVLGYTLPELYKTAAEKGISLTISSLESLQRLAKMRFPKKLRIHVKFDSGLHRQGIGESHIQQTVRTLADKKLPAILEGVYTHFAVMEDPMRQEYSKAQARAFKEFVGKLAEKGWKPLTHASASSGILFSKDFHFGMARAGIALYGLWPSPEIRKWAHAGAEGAPALSPALSWKAVVAEVKLAPKGARVGYDLTHELIRDSRLAVVPVGYWHGLPRSMSGSNAKSGGHIMVCGKRAPIVGRVSMDMAVIDVTDVPNVKQGDEAVIIGEQAVPGGKTERLSAEDAAAAAGTINYEIVTRINPLIPRKAV